MIPSHTLSNDQRSSIVINQLSKLNDYDFSEPHRHDYYELFFFQNGGGVHEIDFVPFEIASGSFQLVVPGQVHQMKRAPGSMGFVLLFGNDEIVHSKAVLDFLLDHGSQSVEESSPCCTFDQNEAAIIEHIILDAWNNKEHQVKGILQHTLIGLCLRMHHKMGVGSTSSNTTYGQFKRLLVSNFREMRTVAAYADQLSITPKALNEVVKKQSGTTASEHIYKQMILEAKRLLLLGSSVKEVAFSLQFDDPAHFSKFFKKQVGTSPADFRNVHT